MSKSGARVSVVEVRMCHKQRKKEVKRKESEMEWHIMVLGANLYGFHYPD